MKKSTIRTEKRPKKFRLLRAFSILFYGPPPFPAGVFFVNIYLMSASKNR